MSKVYEIGTGYTPIPARMGAATEIVVEELTRSLLKNGVDAQIIDIKARDRAKTELPISEVGVPGMFTGTDVSLGIMHKLKRVIYSVKLAGKLKSILKKATEPVILHFHNQYNLYFFYKLVPDKLIKKAKIVYTVHSYIWHGEWSEIEETVNSRYFQEVYCLKRADFVFILNEITEKNITERLGVSRDRVYLIDNGVNTEVYRIMPEDEREALKSRYGIGGKTVFVQAGSVCDRKNQLTALENLCPLMQRDKSVVYCYAGGIISEEYQNDLVRYATENGICDQVKYLGELSPGEELNGFYNLGSAMIFPSKAEGFSLVIIEAMSAGLPVFVSDNLEFKLKDSCIPFSDGDDMLGKVGRHVLDNPEYAALKAEKREVVLRTYGWDKIALDYMRVINKDELNG